MVVDEVCVFFFKQKTAYEMRISDWSSDVCSSDLWCRQMVGMPDGTGGSLVSGGSMANLIALAVARTAKAGIDVREHGVAALPAPLAFYASDQAHSCHRKAVEALGRGHRALRRIPSGADLRDRKSTRLNSSH